MRPIASLAFAGILSVAGTTSTAQAASFYVNFCPADATCPAGVVEASLTFLERPDTTDVNDYFVDLTLVGNASAPDYIDLVSFKIDGVQTPTGYEAPPTLLSAPGGVGYWSTYFDNVSGNAGACTSSTGQQQAVCSNGTDAGVSMVNQTRTWRYDIDLAGAFMLTSGAAVNLRASFLDAEWNARKGKWSYSNAGILSPDGGLLTCLDCDDTPDGGHVPEPTTLILLGLGLLGAAFTARRAAR